MLCARENDVTLWARDERIVAGINDNGLNPRYLTDLEIPSSVRATTDIASAVRDRELVIIAVPSHGVRDVISNAAMEKVRPKPKPNHVPTPISSNGSQCVE